LKTRYETVSLLGDHIFLKMQVRLWFSSYTSTGSMVTSAKRLLWFKKGKENTVLS